MPTSGALLLTNPARKEPPMARLKVNRKKNRKKSRSRRRNGLAIRANGRKANRRKAGSRRRNGLAIRANGRKSNSRRRNGLAIRANGRRRNGLAIRANGRKHNRRTNRRHNGLALRRNGIAQVDKMVSKVPVVGKYLVPVISPALLGAGSLLVVHTALKYGAPYIPASIGAYIEPAAYTLGGAAIGFAAAALPLPPAMKAAFAAAAVVAGGAIDAFRYMTGDEGAVGSPLGDGGAWQVLGDSGPSSAEDDADDLALAAQYSESQAGDAAHCGDDFTEEEGQTAMAGPRFWAHRFPVSRRTVGVVGPVSRHARQRGHRWGWLIKTLGFKKFHALAKLPAEQRVPYIQQLKAHALASLPGDIGTNPAYAGYGAMMHAM